MMQRIWCRLSLYCWWWSSRRASTRNLSAAGAEITFKGRNVHPGTSQRSNDQRSSIGHWFYNNSPEGARPVLTERRLQPLDETLRNFMRSKLIIRDFETESFEKRKDLFAKSIADQMKVRASVANAFSHPQSQYYNMKQVIERLTPMTLLRSHGKILESILPLSQLWRYRWSKISLGFQHQISFAGVKTWRSLWICYSKPWNAVDTIIKGIVPKKNKKGSDRLTGSRYYY